MKSLALPRVPTLAAVSTSSFEWSQAPSTELLLKIERLLHLLSKSDRDNRQTSFQKPLKRILELANDVFGFDGWSTEILSNEITVLESPHPKGPFTIRAEAAVRIRFPDGVFLDSSGEGQMTNSPTKTQAADKAKKEAVTKAIKRGFYSLEQIVDSQVKGDASMWKVKQEM